MTEEKPEVTTPERQLTIAGVPDVYVNATYVTVSPYDVMLRMTHQCPSMTGKDMERQIVAQVWMSHAQAWSAAHLILRLLKNLVEDQGLFLVEDGLLDRLHLREEYEELRRIANARKSSG